VTDTPRVLTIADVYPVLRLRITAGPLELRGISDEDIAALADLAGRGVHPPELMPFSTPWTDVTAAELPLRVAQYYWGSRASFSPAHWALDLAVAWEGEVVGTQGFRTSDYLVTRTGETGSWLGREHQGKGIGTRMRQAMCAFLFDCLDAQQIASGAFVDNPASLAVSRKVGYRANGLRRMVRRPGEWQLNQALVLTPDTFIRGPDITVEGLEPVRRLIGLED
jgi:RimJ/RimL family protein N-acetyltransferase